MKNIFICINIIVQYHTYITLSLRPLFLIRSLSLQFNFILVYYEVTVLLRRCTFYCNWRTASFYCIHFIFVSNIRNVFFQTAPMY